jgi:hypothetical protein
MAPSLAAGGPHPGYPPYLLHNGPASAAGERAEGPSDSSAPRSRTVHGRRRPTQAFGWTAALAAPPLDRSPAVTRSRVIYPWPGLWGGRSGAAAAGLRAKANPPGGSARRRGSRWAGSIERRPPRPKRRKGGPTGRFSAIVAVPGRRSPNGGRRRFSGTPPSAHPPERAFGPELRRRAADAPTTAAVGGAPAAATAPVAVAAAPLRWPANRPSGGLPAYPTGHRRCGVGPPPPLRGHRRPVAGLPQRRRPGRAVGAALRISGRTRCCCKSMGGAVGRSEKLTEPGDSWFSAKSMAVEHWSGPRFGVGRSAPPYPAPAPG